MILRLLSEAGCMVKGLPAKYAALYITLPDGSTALYIFDGSVPEPEFVARISFTDQGISADIVGGITPATAAELDTLLPAALDAMVAAIEASFAPADPDASALVH